MPQIPEHIIDRVRDSVDIVDVISRYVNLKKSGRNFKGLCPFHTEKTPSFTVSPDKQIFHCFGCHVGGNVFNFLMQYEKISFTEAVRKLAEEAGIEIPTRQVRPQLSEYDRLYRANQFAADFYQRLLEEHRDKILPYLEKRGLTRETIRNFKIGYVPEAWDSLHREIQNKNMNLTIFRKLGLILQSEKDPSRFYDRFRNRLMFPIHNVSGKIVAFGGRTLSSDPDIPKYVNSPESPIFKKSEVLYGLFYAKEWIRQEGYAIFVEGYMDFLQLF
jgi:DNA primase